MTSYFEDFHLTSSIKYGLNHISQGVQSLKNEGMGLSSLGEVAWGALECIPLVGMIPGYAEKCAHTWTFEDRKYQHELEVNHDIHSNAFAIQSLYFDVCTKNVPAKVGQYFSLKAKILLDNSTPDRQIYRLSEDLKLFSSQEEANGSLSPEEKEALIKVVGLLDDVKESVLLIGMIIGSSSLEEKLQIKEKLTQVLTDKIENLKDGQSLLVPCGYMNNNIYDMLSLVKDELNGHAMLMKLEKKGESFNVTIFNTGDGVNAHTKLDESIKKDHYYPLCYENISPSQLNREFFNGFTNFSINEGKDKSSQFSGADIYKFLEKEWGKPREMNPSKDKAYQLQTVNNCTKKCLQVWLHDELVHHQKLYKKFRNFRLEGVMGRVKTIINDSPGEKIPYASQFAKLGWTTSTKWKGIPLSAATGVAGGIIGSELPTSLSKEDCKKLFYRAEAVLRKRKGTEISSESTELIVTDSFGNRKLKLCHTEIELYKDSNPELNQSRASNMMNSCHRWLYSMPVMIGEREVLLSIPDLQKQTGLSRQEIQQAVKEGGVEGLESAAKYSFSHSFNWNGLGNDVIAGMMIKDSKLFYETIGPDKLVEILHVKNKDGDSVLSTLLLHKQYAILEHLADQKPELFATMLKEQQNELPCYLCQDLWFHQSSKDNKIFLDNSYISASVIFEGLLKKRGGECLLTHYEVNGQKVLQLMTILKEKVNLQDTTERELIEKIFTMEFYDTLSVIYHQASLGLEKWPEIIELMYDWVPDICLKLMSHQFKRENDQLISTFYWMADHERKYNGIDFAWGFFEQVSH